MRNQEVLSIRPQLHLPDTDMGVAEKFQNHTLRPILKYQNNLLVLVFKSHIVKRKNAFLELTPLQKLDYIVQSVSNDVMLKNRLVGVLMGHFTSEEFQIFVEHETELMRRLTGLLIQRLQSAIKDFE